MVKVETIREDNEKRILKCQEDNRIWYQIWITQLDMNCIERYFDGYGEVKRWWLRNLQQYYVFFYEKKGGKVRGVLGKDRTKDLISCQRPNIPGFFVCYVSMCGCGISRYALNTRSDFCVVLKMCICLQGTP